MSGSNKGSAYVFVKPPGGWANINAKRKADSAAWIASRATGAGGRSIRRYCHCVLAGSLWSGPCLCIRQARCRLDEHDANSHAYCV
jgi:hypothetical protein